MAQRGRPHRISNRLVDRICEGILEGHSLRRVCEDEALPTAALVCRWLATPDPRYEYLRQQYARACEERTEALVELAFDIAEDGSNDWMEKKFGERAESAWVVNGEAVQRSKLRIDLIKWHASRMKPKKYGDRIDVTSDGKALPTPITALPLKDSQTE